MSSFASNFFSELRKLDSEDHSSIIALPVRNTGLGRAINDRLIKAASGFIEKINGEYNLVPKS